MCAGKQDYSWCRLDLWRCWILGFRGSLRKALNFLRSLFWLKKTKAHFTPRLSASTETPISPAGVCGGLIGHGALISAAFLADQSRVVDTHIPTELSSNNSTGLSTWSEGCWSVGAFRRARKSRKSTLYSSRTSLFMSAAPSEHDFHSGGFKDSSFSLFSALVRWLKICMIYFLRK